MVAVLVMRRIVNYDDNDKPCGLQSLIQDRGCGCRCRGLATPCAADHARKHGYRELLIVSTSALPTQSGQGTCHTMVDAQT